MRLHRHIILCLCLIGSSALLPWYAQDGGVHRFKWLTSLFSDSKSGSALAQAAFFNKSWLWIVLIPAFLSIPFLLAARRQSWMATACTVLGSLGIIIFGLQAFLIDSLGWSVDAFVGYFGALRSGQPSLGLGSFALLTAFTVLLSQGVAYKGYFKGDIFTAFAVISLGFLILVFTTFPILKMLSNAFISNEGVFQPSLVLDRLFTEKIWGISCLALAGRCGVAWNTLVLALCTATGATVLGLCFAFLVTRSQFRYKRVLRGLTVLPVITPPFVIGLGLIMILGKSGLVNQFLESSFGIAPSRWIYGFPGVLLAQIFAFTPIAFLVLIGVVEGVAPVMEEAAQTLRANRWQTFVDVTLPLMRPGIVNAFLVAFVESIADFGNPIVLGGDFGVLSTEIFFSIVGAQLDYGRAASLAIILLIFAVTVFFVQRRLLGGKSYVSVGGKGSSGHFSPLPRSISRLAYSIAIPWAVLTMIVYAMAISGGFVETWGRDYSLTLRHYAKAFSIDTGVAGLVWSGGAWSSFWTTLQLASIAAPLTSILGILTAYLLSRQQFRGRNIFEMGTMLSFAVPGTVIGVAYILAFNNPPIELTGTGLIIVLCFMFRNMPVGVRAGMAAMAQIDKNLDEAALTLRANAWVALRTIILPLLKPAIVASLVYSFVRSVTTVSAIIFLVSPDYELATVYIINRVLASDYGVAIAYATVLIALMVVAIAVIQLLVGRRQLGKHSSKTIIASN
jgi:iron(III) transport system permease protein